MNDIIILIALYSFLGWITEVIYAFYKRGQFVNRGFLHGPFCPIYGISLTIIVSLFRSIEGNIIALFAYSFILTSIIEYITSFVMEKVFHSKWWDYSGEKFNIEGRVCLKFSIYWGGAGIIIYKIIHPLITGIVESIPYNMVETISQVLLALLVIDLAFTMNSLIELKTISDKFGKVVAKAKSIKLPDVDRAVKLKDVLLEYEGIKEKLKFNHNRLLRSFPTFKRERFENIIEDVKRELEELKTSGKNR